jgi:2-oxoglutarate ferredoxin oxidoreductase subunit delta
MPSLQIEKDRCKGCELCANACPQQILGMSKVMNTKGYFFAEVREPMRCIGCLICALVCPDVAISVRGDGVQYRLFDYFPAPAADCRSRSGTGGPIGFTPIGGSPAGAPDRRR